MPQPPPESDQDIDGSDPRQQALIASLRQRFAAAEALADAELKQALFREAVYLNLPPHLWQGGDHADAGPDADRERQSGA